MKRLAHILVVGGLLVAGAVSLAVFGEGLIGSEAAADTGAAERPPPLVEVVPVQVAPMSSHIDATTNLVAEHQVTIAAEQNGKVTKLLAQEGETVERGAVVASLDGRGSRLAIKSAKTKLSGAKALRDRAAALADQRLVSAEELEKASTDDDLARHDLNKAKWELSRTRITSPIAGRITKRHVQAGQYVAVGEPIFDVTDFSMLLSRIHIAERDAMKLAPGREVDITLLADESVKFKGTVRMIADVVDTQSGTVEVTIEVRGAPAGVRSGSFVAVQMTRERVDQAKWLPREAVIRSPSGSSVFVLDGDQVSKRKVELGLEQPGIVEIRSGLAVGERVVLGGHGSLDDGAQVRL